MHTILSVEKNPALRESSRHLTQADIASTKIKRLIADMKRLLAKEPYGVALAAVQVGEPVALFVVAGRALARDGRNTPDEPDAKTGSTTPLPDEVYINPTILKTSRGKKEKHEGCLSIRGQWGEVPRAEKVTLSYQDATGKKMSRGASGFLAHIFQHEVDHLQGILYIDKATKLYDEESPASN